MGLDQRILRKKLNFAVALDLIVEAVSDNKIQLRLITDAPKWLKLFYTGDYMAYGNTIYVPPDHLVLMQSSNAHDKLVGIAKLLPWAACIANGDATFWNQFSFRFGYKLRSFYFIYEYVYLKSKTSAYTDLITKGFLVTRKRFGLRVLPETVLDFINSIMSDLK